MGGERLHALYGVDALEFLKGADDFLELVYIDDVDAEGVDGAVVFEGAAVGLGNVEALVVEGLGEKGEDAGFVGADDLNGGGAGGLVVEIPLSVDAALFGLLHGGSAVSGVDGDAATARDDADNGIAGDGRAAFAKANKDIAFSGDANAGRFEAGRASCEACGFGGGLGDDSRGALALGQKLLDDIGGQEPAIPDVHEKLVEALLPQLVDNVDEIAGPLAFGKGQVVQAQLSIDQIAAQLLGLFTLLGAHEVADLGFGGRRFDKLEPVLGGFLVRAGDNLDGIAVAQLVPEGHKLAVHTRAGTVVADIGVDQIRQIDRSRAGWQGFHVAFGREHEDLIGKQIDFDRFHELGRVVEGLLPLHELAEPRKLLVVIIAAAGFALFVGPVGGDAVFGDAVHLVGADLDLDALGLGPDERGVQRLVHVGLGQRDEVFEAARNGGPFAVDDAEGGVTVADVFYDGAERDDVEKLVQIAPGFDGLLVNRPQVFGAPGHGGLDFVFG